MDKISYALGLGIGRQLLQMGANELSIDDFSQAIKDVIGGAELKVNDTEAQQIVQDFFQKQEEKQRAAAAEKGKTAKVCSIKFYARETVKSPKQPTK